MREVIEGLWKEAKLDNKYGGNPSSTYITSPALSSPITYYIVRRMVLEEHQAQKVYERLRIAFDIDVLTKHSPTPKKDPSEFAGQQPVLVSCLV